MPVDGVLPLSVLLVVWVLLVELLPVVLSIEFLLVVDALKVVRMLPVFGVLPVVKLLRVVEVSQVLSRIEVLKGNLAAEVSCAVVLITLVVRILFKALVTLEGGVDSGSITKLDVFRSVSCFFTNVVNISRRLSTFFSRAF